MLKKILSLLLASSLVIGAFSLSFAEKNKTPEDKINHLINMRVIKGYSDGTLRLESSISREEFSSVLAKLMAEDTKDIKSLEGESYFSDVNKESWSNPYINFLFNEGIVKGYKNNTYKPKDNLTFNEAITMIVRSLNVEVDENGAWSEAYINKAKELKILSDVDIKDYSQTANRHKVFELIYNAIQVKN